MAKISRLDEKLSAGRSGLVLFDALNGYLHPQDNPAKVQFLAERKILANMQRLLAEVWRETRKTVVYVTHNVAEAVYLADRVVVMTPHPGMVKTEVPIRLPRPRDPLSVEFLDYQKELLRLLGQEKHA